MGEVCTLIVLPCRIMGDPYDLSGLPPLGRAVSTTLGAGLDDLMDGFEKEEQKAKEMFKEVDKDKSGKLEEPELKELLGRLDIGLDDAVFEKYVKELFKHVDADGSGTIEFKEFMEVYRKIFMDKAHREKHIKKIQKKYMKPDDVKAAREAFFAYDLDSSGEIELEEMKKVLEECGVKLDADGWKQVVQEICDSCDDDHDGKVSFDEFLHFYRKHLSGGDQQKKLKKKVNRKLKKDEEMEAMDKFYELDKDGSGSLDKTELKGLVENLGLDLTSEQYETLVANVFDKGDKDGDQLLDFEEFLYFYKRCLRGEDARRKWTEKVKLRYQDEALNYQCGL